MPRLYQKQQKIVIGWLAVGRTNLTVSMAFGGIWAGYYLEEFCNKAGSLLNFEERPA
jgi:hypothetical protein